MTARASYASNGDAPGRIVHFWCPGCDDAHQVTVEHPDGWGFNGDLERPTFTPSVLVQMTKWNGTVEEYGKWTRPTHPGVEPGGQAICHSFVTDVGAAPPRRRLVLDRLLAQRAAPPHRSARRLRRANLNRKEPPPMTTAPATPVRGVSLLNFGGQPVALVTAVQLILQLLISYGALDGIGLDTKADLVVVQTLVGAVSAVYLAWTTHATLLAPVVELVKAAIAVGLLYHLHITEEQAGTFVAIATVIVGGWQRAQVTPLKRGSFALAA